jgi:hypothetical protein
MLIDKKILQTNGDGFELKESDQVSPIVFTGCKLLVDDKWSRLTDIDDYRIFNIETGLLSCTYTIDPRYDFRVFGLYFSDLLQLDAFDQNFNVMYKRKQLVVDSIPDLDVSRPEVSNFTKERLPFCQDWGTVHDDEKIEEDIVVEDTTDYMQLFIEADLPDDVSKFLDPSDDLGLLRVDEIISYLMESDAIFSMKTTQRIQHSRKIFNIVKNLKYDLICYNMLSEMKISSTTIKMMRKSLKPEYKRNVEYCLVSLYDRLYHYPGASSPKGIHIMIDKLFLEKFKVISEDDD